MKVYDHIPQRYFSHIFIKFCHIYKYLKCFVCFFKINTLKFFKSNRVDFVLRLTEEIERVNYFTTKIYFDKHCKKCSKKIDKNLFSSSLLQCVIILHITSMMNMLVNSKNHVSTIRVFLLIAIFLSFIIACLSSRKQKKQKQPFSPANSSGQSLYIYP